MFKDEVEIISGLSFIRWASSVKYGNPTQPLKPERLQCRIIAFPIHISDPPHWTLGIIVNTSWQAQTDATKHPTWVILHLDSCHCSNRSMQLALDFTCYLLGIKEKDSVKKYEIPVPSQAPKSQDCGLYPAHFLKIFLTNPDEMIRYCTSVSQKFSFFLPIFIKLFQDLSHLDSNSSEAIIRWDGNRGKRLRKQALDIYEYYKDAYSAVLSKIKQH